MAKEATARKLEIVGANRPRQSPQFGGGGPPAGFGSEPVISNARLGVMMFIGAEVMFFAGLIGAFLVFRLSSEVWPPPAQPRLPVLVTGFNTLILLGSGVTVHLALQAIRRGSGAQLVRWLAVTAGLGVLFLAVQGYEWLRLLQFGLRVSSGLYGATFYTLIGLHAVHVLGALVWLGFVWILARKGRYSPAQASGVEVCSMYWIFVVALWPVLYGLVYLY